MPGTGSIGGLVSGLDTATIIDQLISISKKRIDVVVANQTEKSDKIAAFQGFNLKLTDLQADAKTLKDSDTFNVFKTATSTDSTDFTADNLVSVTTTTDASPGTHSIEFTTGSQLAQARQISSQSYSNYDTTELTLSGEILINGSVITIVSTDTLEDIGVKINNANSGTNATKVTASIIAVSDTDNRLILTSNDTGEDKFSILAASDTDLLASLGFTSGSTAIKNTTSDGATSDAFSNSQTAVASLLSLTTPPTSSSVTIGGESVTIDLSTESLTTIAANINTALTSASKGTATVESTTTDGVTTYKIDINGTTSFTDSNNILEALGILEGSQSSVAEIHTGSTSNIKVSTGLIIDDATTYSDIDTGGGANNIVTGDTITISGTKNDGTVVPASAATLFTIDTTKAFNDADTDYGLLAKIESVFGLSAGSAVLNNGKIEITDSTAGDSQLSVNLVANNGNGGTLDFGTISASTEGYSMQSTAGQDAKVKIDGVAVTRSSNKIDDVISGVTLDISRVDSGFTVDVNISRDTDSIKTSVNAFITNYNSTIDFINKEFKFNEDLDESGTLSGETILSSIKTSIQSIITGTISLLPTGSNALSLIGITSDSNGKLTLKDSTFLSEINSDFNAVKRMFIAEGTATNSEVTYIGHTKNTSAGDYDVNITQAATKAGETGELDLSSGLGAGKQETIRITDTVSGRIATITLDGDDTTGNSIDNIVSTINSELDTETTQTLVGDNANTATSTGLAITSSTTFDDITGAGLSNDETITYEGKMRNGIAITGSYQISDVTTNTVQNFLSAIEDDFDNNVSATIDSSGQLVLTDNAVGDSLLEITITEPASLSFGTTVSTSNTGGVLGRYAMEITASKDSNDYLVITNDNYGSTNGFTIAQVVGSDAAAGNEVLLASEANTASSSAITGATLFSAIDGASVVDNDTITISGAQHDGTAVASYDFTITAGNQVETLLDDIETNFGLTAGSVTINGSGQIVITDDTTGISQLSVNLVEKREGGGNLEFGTVASQYTGIANGAKAGLDVAGTINGEAATGTGQLLRGDDPGDGSSSVTELAIKVTSTTESLVGSIANTASSSVITSTTLFSAIDGASVVDNDTITISGTKHDGSAVYYTYTITAANQVENLLDDIENNFGLTAGNVTINSSGKIAISDTFTGDSQLSINLVENNEGSGSLNFGTITPGAKDKIELTMGVAETMYNRLFTFTDSIDGLLTIRIDGLGDTVDNLQETIDGMNERLAIEALMLNNKFVQLELSLSKLQSISNFLAQQLAQLNK